MVCIIGSWEVRMENWWLGSRNSGLIGDSSSRVV